MTDRPRDPTDDDAAWAEIVAAWEAPAADRQHRQALESEDAQALEPPDRPEIEPADRPAVDPPRTWTPAEEPEEHFVPPTPPPLPPTDAITRLAWLGALGGPAYLLVAMLLGAEPRGWALWAAVGGFVGGFLTLVARLGDRDPYDPDDGAVV